MDVLGAAMVWEGFQTGFVPGVVFRVPDTNPTGPEVMNQELTVFPTESSPLQASAQC